MLDVRCHLMIPTRQILGLRFFNGDIDEAVTFMHRTASIWWRLRDMFCATARGPTVSACDALADLAIADSGLMVPTGDCCTRKDSALSGLKYLKQLLTRLKRDENARVFWILPNKPSRQKLLDWFRRKTFPVTINHCYVAPRYGLEIEDRHLLALVEAPPAHIVIAIGAGPVKLGYYLAKICLIRQRSIALGPLLASSPAIRLRSPIGPTAFLSAGFCD